MDLLEHLFKKEVDEPVHEFLTSCYEYPPFSNNENLRHIGRVIQELIVETEKLNNSQGMNAPHYVIEPYQYKATCAQNVLSLITRRTIDSFTPRELVVCMNGISKLITSGVGLFHVGSKLMLLLTQLAKKNQEANPQDVADALCAIGMIASQDAVQIPQDMKSVVGRLIQGLSKNKSALSAQVIADSLWACGHLFANQSCNHSRVHEAFHVLLARFDSQDKTLQNQVVRASGLLKLYFSPESQRATPNDRPNQVLQHVKLPHESAFVKQQKIVDPGQSRFSIFFKPQPVIGPSDDSYHHRENQASSCSMNKQLPAIVSSASFWARRADGGSSAASQRHATQSHPSVSVARPPAHVESFCGKKYKNALVMAFTAPIEEVTQPCAFKSDFTSKP